MDFFGGLEFSSFNHIPKCRSRLDARFEHTALNFVFARRLRWQVDNGPEVILHAPAAFWSWPGPRFRYGALQNESWDHYYVAFLGSRATRWRRSGLIPTTKTSDAWRPVFDANAYRDQFEVLLRQLAANPIDTSWAVHLLEGLLLKLHVQQHPPMEVRSELDRAIDELSQRIREAPEHDWDIQKEASALGCSYSNFRRRFRELTDLAPRQYVLKARMDAAALRLRTSSAPIKQIAHDVGVGDVYYFAKLFRQHYRMPPAKYRRQAQLLFA